MRDSLVFYRSFYEAIKDLPAEQYKQCMDAIMQYALDGIEPSIGGIAYSIFTLVKPQIDANNKRFENGKKGGRPSKSTENTEVTEVTETKEKPNRNQTKTKVKPNVNVNVNVNENKEKFIKEIGGRYPNRNRNSRAGPIPMMQRDYDFDELESLALSSRREVNSE